MLYVFLTNRFDRTRSNDAKFSHHFAKWRDMDPKCAKSNKKSEFGRCPGVQDLPSGCVGALDFSSGCPGRDVLP